MKRFVVAFRRLVALASAAAAADLSPRYQRPMPRPPLYAPGFSWGLLPRINGGGGWGVQSGPASTSSYLGRAHRGHGRYTGRSNQSCSAPKATSTGPASGGDEHLLVPAARPQPLAFHRGARLGYASTPSCPM